MRVERSVADVETWAQVVAALPAEIVHLADFRGEQSHDGFVVSMAAEVSSAVDAELNDIPGRQRRRLIVYAADRRWRREAGGIVVGGVPVATDDRSKVMIVGARVAAEANAAWSTNWHGADGQIYPINASDMIAISAAVEAHINSCFAIFAQVKMKIEAGVITSISDIDAYFAV